MAVAVLGSTITDRNPLGRVAIQLHAHAVKTEREERVPLLGLPLEMAFAGSSCPRKFENLPRENPSHDMMPLFYTSEMATPAAVCHVGK